MGIIPFLVTNKDQIISLIRHCMDNLHNTILNEDYPLEYSLHQNIEILSFVCSDKFEIPSLNHTLKQFLNEILKVPLLVHEKDPSRFLYHTLLFSYENFYESLFRLRTVGYDNFPNSHIYNTLFLASSGYKISYIIQEFIKESKFNLDSPVYKQLIKHILENGGLDEAFSNN